MNHSREDFHFRSTFDLDSGPSDGSRDVRLETERITCQTAGNTLSFDPDALREGLNEMHLLRDSLRTTVCDAGNVDLRPYEISDTDRIADELKLRSLELAERAQSVLSEVTRHCDRRIGPVESEVPSTRAQERDAFCFDPQQVADRPESIESVSEIAFVARMELRQRGERVRALDRSDSRLHSLGECDSCLRSIRRALSAVENALAAALGVPPLLRFTSDLQVSLAVRNDYAKWTAQLLSKGDHGAGNIRARLRSAGTMIAMLVGWEVYPELRVSDRLLLRELQNRLLTWLRAGDEADRREGLRLWQDLASTVEIFALVNRRQELVDHDQRAVRELLHVLRASDASMCSSAVVDRLRPLMGLDPEIYAFLDRSGPLPVSEIRPVLERLAVSFGNAERSRNAERVEVAPW